MVISAALLDLQVLAALDPGALEVEATAAQEADFVARVSHVGKALQKLIASIPELLQRMFVSFPTAANNLE